MKQYFGTLKEIVSYGFGSGVGSGDGYGYVSGYGVGVGDGVGDGGGLELIEKKRIEKGE